MIIFVVAIFALSTIKILANPSFTIGSNPYLTIHAYPHDILKWPKNGLFLAYVPQTLPCQGDVTNIFNHPSESYVNNYQNVEFSTPYGYEDYPSAIHSWMKVTSYARNNAYSLGGMLSTRLGKLLFEAGRSTLKMELDAEGVARAYDDDSGHMDYFLVPFQGETNAYRENMDFEFIYANTILGNPIGVKFRYISKSSDLPSGYIKFTRDGTKYNTPHMTWGWATQNCNHIFGYSHINADAFYQNSFSVLNGHQMDTQISFEYSDNFKSSIRYRQKSEMFGKYSNLHQCVYYWFTDLVNNQRKFIFYDFF